MRHSRFLNYIVDYYRRADKILWLIIAFISIYSLTLLRSVSRATNTDYYEVQLLAITLGVVGALVLTFIDYSTLANYWHLIAFASVFLMLFTAFFGVNVSGSGGVNATAWINVFGRTFQTSELVKIGFIITCAKHLDTLKKKEVLNQPFHIILVLIHGIIPFLLCNLQGDDGAGIVFFAMFLFMCYAAGVHARYFIILFSLALIAVPLIWNYALDEFQIERFTSVYNLDDPTVAMDGGYQQYQARITIGSGGLFGKGLFEGDRVQSGAVTFQHSDFIFSVAGEELGFIGSVMVILSLVVLTIRVLYIAGKSRDSLGEIMCFGFLGLVVLQSITNIGMCLAILPVMGVTLPFYSAGGSSAACLYFAIGLLQSVYMRREYIDGVKLRGRTTTGYSYKRFKELGM